MTLKMAERVETTMHPSICMGDALPKPILEGKNYRCRFCGKVGEYAYIAAHQQTHTAVKHGGYKMYRCYSRCLKATHFHCCYCGETRTQKTIWKHVQKCRGAASMVTPAASTATSSASTVAYPVFMVTSPVSAAFMVTSTAPVVAATASIVTSKASTVSIVNSKASTDSAASTVASAAPMVTSTASATPMVSFAAPMVTSTASSAPMVTSTASSAPMVTSTASSAPMVTSTASSAPMVTSTASSAPMVTSTASATPMVTSAAPMVTSSAPMVTSTASATPMVTSAAPMVTSAAPMVTSTASAAPMVTSTASAAPMVTSAAPTVATASAAYMVTSAASPLASAASAVATASVASTVASAATAVVSAASAVASATSTVATASVASAPLQDASSGELLESSLKRTTCPFCGLVLNKKNLKIHVDRRHSATASVASGPVHRISSSNVLRSSPERTTCPDCNLTLNKKNLKAHIDRRHSPSTPDITANHHLPSQCLDRIKGIFAVGRTFCGLRNPIHVQRCTWGTNHRVICELDDCKQASELCRRSGLMGFQCDHLRSLLYCPVSSERDVTLKEEVLSDLVRRGWMSDDEKNTCLARKEEAESENSPLSEEVTFCSGASRIYVSVLEPCWNRYSRLGRVAVCYDKRRNAWLCPCSKKTNYSCPHKSIAKWHLNQTQPELFLNVRCTDNDVFETFPEWDREGHSTDSE